MAYTITQANSFDYMINPLIFIILIIAITIHEFAHALIADRLGDPTPRSLGRLSLNPLKHLDPIGTLMIIVARFGWGKPVPIDPYNFHSPRRDELLVSLAGPGSNLFLAGVAGTLNLFLPPAFTPIFYTFALINISLALFNLLPFPPLDGSKIILNLLPVESSIDWSESLDRYGQLILILLFILPIGGGNILSLILSPPTSLLLHLLF
jgi:Zn-dependent protease